MNIAEQILNLTTEVEALSIEKMVLACEQRATSKEQVENGTVYSFEDGSKIKSDNDWGLDLA